MITLSALISIIKHSPWNLATKNYKEMNETIAKAKVKRKMKDSTKGFPVESFIKNKEEVDPNYSDLVETSAADTLDLAFSWSGTPEGSSYWHGWYNKLNDE